MVTISLDQVAGLLAGYARSENLPDPSTVDPAERVMAAAAFPTRLLDGLAC